MHRRGGVVMSASVDRVGAVASGLCAVHCALVALLPVVFSTVGLKFLMGHGAEWGFTLVAIAFASIALVQGWRRHRSHAGAGLLVLGIVGLLASRGLEMGSGHEGHSGEHHDKPHPAAANDTGAKRAASKHADEHKADKRPAVHNGKHGERHGDGHRERHDDGKHHDGHGDGHGHGDGGAHLAGTGVGVLAGLLLIVGHIFNIRATRTREEECCP